MPGKPEELLAELEALERRLYGDKTRLVTFKAPEDMVREIDVLAFRTGRNRSELIRLALVLLLREVEARSRSGVRIVRLTS